MTKLSPEEKWGILEDAGASGYVHKLFTEVDTKQAGTTKYFWEVTLGHEGLDRFLGWYLKFACHAGKLGAMVIICA